MKFYCQENFHQISWKEITVDLNSIPGSKNDWKQWRKIDKVLNMVTSRRNIPI